MGTNIAHLSTEDIVLLRLAALAAGEWPSPEPFEHVMWRWNPLYDDAAAFRLQVKLGLFVSHSAYKPGENAYGFIGIAWYAQREHFEPERFTADPYAATRRAIVRAAAEIGKSMA